jgi:hypothetical protein
MKTKQIGNAVRTCTAVALFAIGARAAGQTADTLKSFGRQEVMKEEVMRMAQPNGFTVEKTVACEVEIEKGKKESAYHSSTTAISKRRTGIIGYSGATSAGKFTIGYSACVKPVKTVFATTSFTELKTENGFTNQHINPTTNSITSNEANLYAGFAVGHNKTGIVAGAGIDRGVMDASLPYHGVSKMPPYWHAAAYLGRFQEISGFAFTYRFAGVMQGNERGVELASTYEMEKGVLRALVCEAEFAKKGHKINFFMGDKFCAIEGMAPSNEMFAGLNADFGKLFCFDGLNASLVGAISNFGSTNTGIESDRVSVAGNSISLKIIYLLPTKENAKTAHAVFVKQTHESYKGDFSTY